MSNDQLPTANLSAIASAKADFQVASTSPNPFWGQTLLYAHFCDQTTDKVSDLGSDLALCTIRL